MEGKASEHYYFSSYVIGNLLEDFDVSCHSLLAIADGFIVLHYFPSIVVIVELNTRHIRRP
jgi:hypothetical protein